MNLRQRFFPLFPLRFAFGPLTLCTPVMLCLVIGGCTPDAAAPKPTADNAESSADEEAEPDDTPRPPRLQSEPFGTLPTGEEVTRYHLMNGRGIRVSVIDYGGIITAVHTPDRNGNTENIVLGFESLDGYLAGHPYFGCIVGRFANRIAGGTFTLNDREYELATNAGPHHLHGGKVGFDKRVWQSEPFETSEEVGVRLRYVSPDGEEGYPGTLRLTVTYTLTEADELRIDYQAVAQSDTVLNLTNHSYWNLAIASQGNDVLDHLLKIDADEVLTVDEKKIPTGAFTSVEGTPLDFREPHPLGERIESLDGNGYDHCYVLQREPGAMRHAATLTDPRSGRRMEVHTDQPGLQLYTGNGLSANKPGQWGPHFAVCLETQHFPDSPNQPAFPTTVLGQGQVFQSTTTHQFSVVE